MIRIELESLNEQMLEILACYLDRYVDTAKHKENVLIANKPYLVSISGENVSFTLSSNLYRYVCNSNSNQYAYAAKGKFIGSGADAEAFLSGITLKFSDNPDNNKLQAANKSRVIKITPCGSPLEIESIITKNPIHKGKTASIISEDGPEGTEYAMFMAYFPYSTVKEVVRNSKELLMGMHSSAALPRALTGEEFMRMFIRVAKAVRYVRRHGMYYGDPNNENFMLQPIIKNNDIDFNVFTIDFGASRKLDSKRPHDIAQNEDEDVKHLTYHLLVVLEYFFKLYTGKWDSNPSVGTFMCKAMTLALSMNKDELAIKGGLEDYAINDNRMFILRDRMVPNISQNYLSLDEVISQSEDLLFEFKNRKSMSELHDDQKNAVNAAKSLLNEIEYCFVLDKNKPFYQRLIDLGHQEQLILSKLNKFSDDSLPAFLYYLSFPEFKDCTTKQELIDKLEKISFFIGFQFNKLSFVRDALIKQTITDKQIDRALQCIEIYFKKLSTYTSELSETCLFATKLEKLFDVLRKILVDHPDIIAQLDTTAPQQSRVPAHPTPLTESETGLTNNNHALFTSNLKRKNETAETHNNKQSKNRI